MGYEEVRHTADVAVRAWGESLEELFASAAAGMFSLVGEPGSLSVTRQLELTAEDTESLLVDWLNELIFLSESTGELYAEFAVEITGDTRLRAAVRGGPAARSGIGVKAATYHGLQIDGQDNLFTATVVFDT